MNTDILKRTSTKAGKDTSVAAVAYLAANVVAERVDLSNNEYGLVLLGLTIGLGIVYRLLRAHGMMLPDEGEVAIWRAEADAEAEPTIGGNV